MMHTLFTREHNAICGRLLAEYPVWSDDQVFAHARLILAAVIAKIHTVEWTPALLGHPTSQAVMQANWWGLETERLHRLFGCLGKSELIGGVPGSPTNHVGVPSALTEECTIVYRMHPLIPDDFSFRALADDRLICEHRFPDLAGLHADAVVRQIQMSDLFSSFGASSPGAIVLHNYPRSLQQFQRPDAVLMDLVATDILRSRELGVSRYNHFRRLLHLPPAGSFEELVEDPAWAQELRRVSDHDLERVDLIVGMFAEQRPPGFALMAPHRLNSDRFFTADYRPEIYTQLGLEWIRDTTFSALLLWHYPHLQACLQGVTNAFTPCPGGARGGISAICPSTAGKGKGELS